MAIYTAFLTDFEPRNGVRVLQEFIQTTFAKRGIIITHFHDTIYQKIDGYRIATIKFNFFIEFYNSRNQTSYAERILYRLNKFADDEAIYNAEYKQTRKNFKPSIEPFEIVHTPETRETWIVKLVRPTVY
jgi:hypothetical protein